MRRSELVVHRGGTERRIRLSPFAALLVGTFLVALAVALIALVVVFGSIVLGVALGVALVAFAIAVVRDAWSRLWR